MARKTRGIRVITEETEKDVTFLTDVDVEFVSLVRHGANQMHFRVIKSETKEKGGDRLRTVIQSIILPRNTTLDAMADTDGLSWLVEAKSDELEEFDDYTKLIQIPVEKFDSDSLNLVKLHDNGTFAVVGKLESDDGLEDALVLGSREMKSMIPLPQSPMDATVAEGPPVPAYLVTFRQMFEKELMSFIDVVNGTLSQSNSDPGLRKKTVLGSLDAFKAFMAVGLDALAGAVEGKCDSGGKKKKKDDSEGLQMVQEQLTKMQETIRQALDAEKDGGTKKMFQFETKEEFMEAVESVVSDVLEAKSAEKTDEKPAEDGAKKEDNALIQGVVDQMKSLTETVQGLVQKTETLGNSFMSNREPEGDDQDKKKEAKKSIFSGLLTS